MSPINSCYGCEDLKCMTLHVTSTLDPQFLQTRCFLSSCFVSRESRPVANRSMLKFIGFLCAMAAAEMDQLHHLRGHVHNQTMGNDTNLTLAKTRAALPCFDLNDRCWRHAQCCSGRCQESIRRCRPVRWAKRLQCLKHRTGSAYSELGQDFWQFLVLLPQTLPCPDDPGCTERFVQTCCRHQLLITIQENR